MGGGMTAMMKGEYQHSAKLISSFAHNLNRIEAGLYNIDRRIFKAIPFQKFFLPAKSVNEFLNSFGRLFFNVMHIVAYVIVKKTLFPSKALKISRIFTSPLNNKKSAAEQKTTADFFKFCSQDKLFFYPVFERISLYGMHPTSYRKSRAYFVSKLFILLLTASHGKDRAAYQVVKLPAEHLCAPFYYLTGTACRKVGIFVFFLY